MIVFQVSLNFDLTKGHSLKSGPETRDLRPGTRDLGPETRDPGTQDPGHWTQGT